MSYVVHYEDRFLRQRKDGGWAVTADVEKAASRPTVEEASAMADQCVREAAGTAPARLAKAARVEHKDEFKPFSPSF